MDAFGTGWHFSADGECGALAGELSTWPTQTRKKRERKSQRRPVDLDAGLRQRGANGIAVRILDLSEHGFRAATHLVLEPGSDVWLRLPGLESSRATVAWQEGHHIGCSFERPLHPAVLDMIVRKARGSA